MKAMEQVKLVTLEQSEDVMRQVDGEMQLLIMHLTQVDVLMEQAAQVLQGAIELLGHQESRRTLEAEITATVAEDSAD